MKFKAISYHLGDTDPDGYRREETMGGHSLAGGQEGGFITRNGGHEKYLGRIFLSLT